MRVIDLRPPRIGLLFALVAAALHVLLFARGAAPLSSPALGVALAIAGSAVMMRAWWRFKAGNIAICPTAHTARLLTDDVYRLSRNPMYLGMVSMLLGLAVAIGTLPFYLATFCYFAVLNFVFCPYEERKLENAFGTQYLDYKAKARRWL